ncbi:tRNA dihydrouridine synthase [Savitreella phatthalungensis]
MTAAAAIRATRDTSLRGRAFYESLGSPKLILAPMVDGSELCWRELSRRHGADLCYTPMFHAKMFSDHPKNRAKFWSSMLDRPERGLIVQFCANDPQVLLRSARVVEPYCDAVDINFGCPQGVARKGRYGAFLQEDWDTVGNLVRTLADNLSIPVTAKIRILETPQRTLEYARHVLASGASWLAVHCRTREQKGQFSGLGDWSVLRYLRDNIPPEVVLLANGNVLYHEDIHRCLETTGFDGMLVAETNLHNPAIFTKDAYPRLDQILAEYLEILDQEDDPISAKSVRGHVFKLIKPFLDRFPEYRATVGACGTRDDDGRAKLDEVLRAVEREVTSFLEKHPEPAQQAWPRDARGYRQIPWYRAQPYYRPLRDPPSKAAEEHAADASLKRSIDVVQAGDVPLPDEDGHRDRKVAMTSAS